MPSILLFPFAFLYDLVTRLRNLLYDWGWKRSHSFDRAVISVGNLNVGGSGKTPMIEYLVNLLSKKYSIAILSRGYGRTTHGFLLAEKHDDATTIGDEPFQFYRKYGNWVSVVVCESRVEGIAKLLKKIPSVQVILLDDAFQHRAVKPLFSVLLTDSSKPFFNDYVLPMGRLREARSGSVRADVMVVTKCSDLSDEKENEFKNKLSLYSGSKPVFFSGVRYKTPKAMDGDIPINKNIVLVTGIADSRSMADYVSSHFNLLHHFNFNDHHHYSIEDIRMIQMKTDPSTHILTTEKDMVKLVAPGWLNILDKKLWFYLPIESCFLKNGSEFDEMLEKKIEVYGVMDPKKNK